MRTYTIHKAKTELSRLIAMAEAGEEVVIARGKTPVVRLEPIADAKPKKRVPGLLKGKLHVPDEALFDPPPEEELRAWEGAYSWDGEETER